MNEITESIIEALKAQTPAYKESHKYIGVNGDGVVYWEEGPDNWAFNFSYGGFGFDPKSGTGLEDFSDLLHEDIEFVEAETSYSVYAVLR